MEVLLVDSPDSLMADFVNELLETVSPSEDFTVLAACDERTLIDFAESCSFDLAVIIPNNFKFPQAIVIEGRLRQSLEYSERLQSNGCAISIPRGISVQRDFCQACERAE